MNDNFWDGFEKAAGVPVDPKGFVKKLTRTFASKLTPGSDTMRWVARGYPKLVSPHSLDAIKTLPKHVKGDMLTNARRGLEKYKESIPSMSAAHGSYKPNRILKMQNQKREL